jgi:hypothetical protein
MPIVHSALDAFTVVSPAGFRSFDHERTELAVRKLAELFDVNPAVARIRISQLFPADSRKQLTF